MTSYGQDASHYDSPLTSRDGLSFYTHKCTDGAHFYMDAEYKAALNAAKGLGIPILGAYHVLWQVNPSAQMDWFYSQVNTLTPWWKDVPFMWQLDCEPFSYTGGTPNKSAIQTSVNYLISKYKIDPKCILAYAPKWVYADRLAGLSCALWASSYVSASGSYKSLYPGDGSIKWNAYSGQVPLILQYTSSAIIAGQTTCDANAFRGSEQELISYLKGSQDMTPAEFVTILKDPVVAGMMKALPWQYMGGGIPAGKSALGVLNDINTRTATPAQVNITLTDAQITTIATKIAALLPASSITIDDVKAAIIATVKVG